MKMILGADLKIENSFKFIHKIYIRIRGVQLQISVNLLRKVSNNII